MTPQQQRSDRPAAGELVTVVIPCLNEERSISACLESVLGQSHQSLEVLVVDGGSADRTTDLVEAFARVDGRVRLLHNADRVQPAAMNLAVAEATGRYLVRIDAHATVAPGFVAGVVAHLLTGEWGGVGGRKDAVGFSATGRAIAAVLGSRFGVGNSAYHHATEAQEVDHVPFGAYPIEVIHDVGGWDASIAVNEDYEFDYRVRSSGRRLLLDPSLVIAWEGRQTLPLLARQYRRYGRGKAKVVRKHPTSTAARHLVPPAVVAALGLAVLLAPVRPRWSAAIALPYVGLLGLGTVVVGARLAERDEVIAVPGAMATMHLAWGWGFWEGLLGAEVVQKDR